MCNTYTTATKKRAKQHFRRFRSYAPYGDFYPLSPCSLGPGSFIAYQFHRADLDAGIVLAFRRSECPYPVLQTALHGLRPDITYRVEFIDDSRASRAQNLPGRDLISEFEVRLPRRGASLLVRYEPLASR